MQFSQNREQIWILCFQQRFRKTPGLHFHQNCFKIDLKVFLEKAFEVTQFMTVSHFDRLYLRIGTEDVVHGSLSCKRIFRQHINLEMTSKFHHFYVFLGKKSEETMV